MCWWTDQDPLSPRLATGNSPAVHWPSLSLSLSIFFAPKFLGVCIIIIIIIWGETKPTVGFCNVSTGQRYFATPPTTLNPSQSVRRLLPDDRPVRHSYPYQSSMNIQPDSNGQCRAATTEPIRKEVHSRYLRLRNQGTQKLRPSKR